MSAASVARDLPPPEPLVEREDERRRLARELHDGPAQSLAAALFGVDLAMAALDRQPDRARDELIRAREQVRDALDDVRGLMAGLRPRLLEERGLVAALQALASPPALWGPDVTIETGGIRANDRLPPAVELALFRVAQEAVSNARRHGGASRVVISVGTQPGAVKLTVSDDGVGFDPLRVNPGPGRGEGIHGIRERITQLGGEARIDSALGAGTRVEVTLPLR
jgi:two-component system sensor histidine kinase DegS